MQQYGMHAMITRAMILHFTTTFAVARKANEKFVWSAFMVSKAIRVLDNDHQVALCIY